uniref:Uncharacterized protein n=1 Tax=viral metagenome TaxID=1070528 RepID=A0A6M3KR86_9ZZZZ
MAETQRKPNALDNIKSWIPVILIVASLIVGWTVMDQRIQQVQIEQALMTIKIEKFSQENISVQVRLAEIQKDISYIRLSLDEHMRLHQPGK